MNQCPKCGAQLTGASEFCGLCGFPVQSSAAEVGGSALPPPTMPAPAAPESLISAVPGPSADPAPSVAPPPSIDLTVRRPVSSTPTSVAVPVAEPAKKPRKTGLIVALGVLVVAAVVAGVLILGGGDDEKKSSTGAPGTTTATTEEEGVSTTVGPSTVPPTTDDSAAQAAAADELAGYAAESQTMVADLNDKFVVQFARLNKGGEGQKWDAISVVAEYMTWRDQFMAVLVDGATFQFAADNSEPIPNAYFVFAPVAFDKRAAAEQWCKEQAVAEENCAIRKIKPIG